MPSIIDARIEPAYFTSVFYRVDSTANFVRAQTVGPLLFSSTKRQGARLKRTGRPTKVSINF